MIKSKLNMNLFDFNGIFLFDYFQPICNYRYKVHAIPKFQKCMNRSAKET